MSRNEFPVMDGFLSDISEKGFEVGQQSFDIEEKAINPSKAAKAAENLWDLRRGAYKRGEKYTNAYRKVSNLSGSPIKEYAEGETYGRMAQQSARGTRYHNTSEKMREAAEAGGAKVRPDVGHADEMTIPAKEVHAPQDRERYFYRKEMSTTDILNKAFED